MSSIAIATSMAIDHNYKILAITTGFKDTTIEESFFDNSKNSLQKRLGLMQATNNVEAGVEGLSRIVVSGRGRSGIVPNYVKVVFKDRLEILLGADEKKRDISVEEDREITEEYINLISVARMYYDKVFVDLDDNLSEEIRQRIIDSSDLVIVNTTQNFNSLKKLKEKKENDQLLQSPRSLILIGRYDKFSKYNVKNVTRYLNEKNQVLTIPYNTLYFEATNEAGVPDLFLRFRKISDSDDRNAIFAAEVKRTAENIIYRLQELEARM